MRAKVLPALDEQAEAQGMALAERYGLLHGIQFLLPWVGWESADAQREFGTILRQMLGAAGVTEGMLGEWAGGGQGAGLIGRLARTDRIRP